jgi:hypothetical protein
LNLFGAKLQKIKRKQKQKRKKEKKEKPTQLGRPGATSPATEPTEPRIPFLSLSDRQGPPVGFFFSNGFPLSLPGNGNRRPLLPPPLTPRTVNAFKKPTISTPDPLSHPLFFPAQELTARPRIWPLESADADTARRQIRRVKALPSLLSDLPLFPSLSRTR